MGIALIVLAVGLALTVLHSQETATITPTGLSLATPRAEAYGIIKVKGFGVDLINSRAQIVGAYFNVDGKEGEGFTVDISDSTAFATFFTTCNSRAALLRELAKARKRTIR
jgi:hypothetical protein